MPDADTAPSEPLSAAQHFQQAALHHQAGRLPDAEKHYRAALALEPRHPDANHNLGALALHMKQPAGALPFLKAALEVNSAHPQYWTSYIYALMQTGQTDAARQALAEGRKIGLAGEAIDRWERQLDPLTAMTRAVEREPNSAEAHTNLGAALRAAGRLDEAVISYGRALALNPDLAEAHSNLGNALRAMGREAEAVTSLERALALKPDLAQTHSNLGAALHTLGRTQEAIASFEKSIALKPDLAEAHNNLGSALQSQGQAEAAEACLRRAIAINPSFAEAHCNLGNALQSQNRAQEAAQSFQAALAVRPDFIEAWSNLGNILMRQGRVAEAEAAFRRVIALDPACALGYAGLGNALHNLGRLQEAVDALREATTLDPQSTDTLSSLLFSENCLPEPPMPQLLADARRYGELVASRARPSARKAVVADDRRLRVGLVSADLRAHPVGHFVEGLLAALAADPSHRIEAHAYANHRHGDEVTARIKANCAGWRVIHGLSDAATAALIGADGMDILIDLGGHTAHSRLPVFAWKPAPVQVSWLGYFATTGVSAIDYFLADPWTAPPGEEGQFMETVWRLPETFLCMAPPAAELPLSPPPALTAGHVTFGCFNNLSKLNGPVIALWSRLLDAVPQSRLLLKTKALEDETARTGLIARFAAQGVSADRLILDGPSSREDYLAAYGRVDIGLDPFPYPGGTTSVESLWMGVPVVTRAGDRLLSHQGETIARNAGLADWIAADDEAYLRKAVAAAADLGALASLRAGLRDRVAASPLFNAPRFAAHFAEALHGMWRATAAKG